jgi:hypothetical protein
MTRFNNPDRNNAQAIQNKAIIRALIPQLWKQAFIAPMAMEGDYERIGIQSPLLEGMQIRLWKDHMEVHYKEDVWSVTWTVGRPWHITGGWAFSSNWRNAGVIMPALIATLVKHSIQTTQFCQF